MCGYGEEDLRLHDMLPTRLRAASRDLLEQADGNLPVSFSGIFETIPEGETIPLRICISGEKRELQETMGSKVWVDRHYREQLWLGYFNSKEFYSNRTGWYLGALHTRTRMSGGENTIREAVRERKQMASMSMSRQREMWWRQVGRTAPS